jgi:hypothetical protein
MVGPNQGLKQTEKISRQFLTWLDESATSDGQRYVEVRQRLELYFDRKNCVAPGELADETLNRVARKLEENGEITDVPPLQYCYSVAQYVFLEALGAGNRAPFYRPMINSSSSNIAAQLTSLSEGGAASEYQEKIANCLGDCVSSLSTADRELIVEYYRGEPRGKIERRSALAARLGLTENALRVRAHRLRHGLEACIPAYVKKPQGVTDF